MAAKNQPEIRNVPLGRTFLLRRRWGKAIVIPWSWEDAMSDREDRPESDDNLVEEESLDEMAERMQVPSATAAGSIRFPVVDKKSASPQKPAVVKKQTG
jgi:hypothetical protein